MMFLLALILQTAAYPPPPPAPPVFVVAQQQAPEPRHLPSHTKGPHEGEPNAICYRYETQEYQGLKYYHCACKQICEGIDTREDDDCVTSCSKDGEQCKCHHDEPPCGMEQPR